MEALILNQEDKFENLTRAFTNYKKSPKDRITVDYIEARLESLEKLYATFLTTHSNILGMVQREKKSTIQYFTDDIYSQMEEAYIEYKTKLKDDLRARKTPETTLVEGKPQQAMPCEVKLPQIKLPTFSGDYEEWQTFYDLFRALIHNNANLTPVQKLHYLKGSLSGEPENLLKTLATTDSNYDEAWKQLTRRYLNQRYNCNEIMKRLFLQKSLTQESSNGVKQLLDTTNACLKSLSNIGVIVKDWDVIINYLVVSKLDNESRRLWEIKNSQLESEELPSWENLTNFLESRFRTLEMIDGGKNAINNFKVTAKPVYKQKSFHAAVSKEKGGSINNKDCKLCSGQHLLFQCKQFGKQTPKERYEYIQSQNLCYNCLAPTHTVRQCHQATCCRRCGRRHHTLLHMDKVYDSNNLVTKGSDINQAQETNQSSEVEKKVVTHFAKQESEVNVLLATAIAKAKSTNGYSQLIRLLIDQGSEASFVTEAMVQSLGLQRSSVNGLVSGVGDGQTNIKHMVQLSLESLQEPEFSVQVQAYVLKNLTSFLPSAETNIINWPAIESLPLADPEYGSPAKIDMILGADIHSDIIKAELIKHPEKHGPIAQNTQFGWVLSGRVNQKLQLNPRTISLHLQVKEDQLLKIFWEIEREPDEIKKKLTNNEVECEEFYEKTTIRDTDGRYVVRLPFKNSNPDCLEGKSEEIAKRRFISLERKLKKDLKLYEEYRKGIDDYIVQNHMVQIANIEEIQKKEFVYLPHHPVIREDKETTRLRIVFDASCKGINNISLNDNLRVGPKLQQDLRHILMRWRLHPICIVADLKQMYRQVLVHKDDTDFQRILWRPNPDMPMQHYKLLRLTFGTSCAPYLAVKTIQQLAKDEQSKFPIAAKITMEDYYMDDVLTGCETTEQAIEIYNQMTSLMSAGGFTLQKWNSNSHVLLDHIREDNKGSEALVLKFNDVIKVLGIRWCQTTDCFEYTLQLPDLPDIITKRNVLSNISRLYDPMGWIAPIIVTAKIYIQNLWKSGLSWDDKLTEELQRQWCAFREDLSNVGSIIIPRWTNTTSETKLELHAFADASQSAYAAAVYLKTVNKDGNVSVNLVTAKTKVSPIGKELSIPRLELCAALLASKLIYETSQILKVPKENLFAWSDSTVVLAWIDGEPSRWTTFVSNRVSEILTILEKYQWSHVQTSDNPADIASRGMLVSRLIDNSLWWHGPWWLKEKTNQGRKTKREFTTQEEQRAIKNFVAVQSSREEDQIFTRFSSLSKTLNILARCKRMLTKERGKFVTVEEKNAVLEICIKHSQGVFFEEEIKVIKIQGSVPKKNHLHTLCPILDKNGILRVGGRINCAQVDYDKRYPIIMPSESHITNLIITDAHTKTLHGGPQIMLNFLRSKYWIIRARTLVKKCYRKCITCVRYSRQDNNQYMGQLPETRLTPSRPFQKAGVDFTGHINLRMSHGRGSRSYKGYICVFVCMITKAIHLEAVSDLTAKGFIAAFRRFVSRRGHCKDLYSDNGTNFVGAEKELRKMLCDAKSQISEDISQQLANDGTTWHFIPPHSPNFGGLWEAGVRCMKSHLKRVVGDSTLTYEELSTVLTQIEACLNSRPLSYISDNPDEPLPLTPSHFLIGEPLIVVPEKNYLNTSITGLQRWKFCQKMVNDFWKRWSEEYLVTLNQRYKWFAKKDEPEINDIVIIKDHNQPPAKWLLGKVVQKHPGVDNITRVVSIKTKSGVYKRPCNKLCYISKA